MTTPVKIQDVDKVFICFYLVNLVAKCQHPKPNTTRAATHPTSQVLLAAHSQHYDVQVLQKGHQRRSLELNRLIWSEAFPKRAATQSLAQGETWTSNGSLSLVILQAMATMGTKDRDQTSNPKPIPRNRNAWIVWLTRIEPLPSWDCGIASYQGECWQVSTKLFPQAVKAKTSVAVLKIKI